MEIRKNVLVLSIICVLLVVGIVLFIRFRTLSKNVSSVKTVSPAASSTVGATDNFISLPLPLGAYTSYSAEHQPKGIIDENQEDKLAFDNINHHLAQLIWFGNDGFLEYHIKNPLSQGDKIKALRLFAEVSSETWGYSLDHKTDLSFYVNGIRIGQYTIPSDFGGKRGKYTPEWWPTANTQYGEPLFVEVKKDGTYIANNYSDDWKDGELSKLDFKKISGVTISDLSLGRDYIDLKLGVNKDATNQGGLNVFGEKFGNYHKSLTLGIEYLGRRIYQPTISEIINNPNRFNGNTVLLAVHPGGWSCPSKKGTAIPEGFSRSATMVYDSTGCLYGNGSILAGKILSPEIHSINVPGKETIIIEGKIQLDKNDIPFITPLTKD